MHAVRAALNVTASLFMLMALSISPLAEVAALSFSAPCSRPCSRSCLWVSGCGRDASQPSCWGFAGTWLVFRPGLVAVAPGSLLVLAFAVAWGGAMIAIKALSRTESSLTQTLYLGLLNTPIAALAAIPVWQTPSLGQLAWLAALGAVGVVRQLSLSQAFKEADATAILPLDLHQADLGRDHRLRRVRRNSDHLDLGRRHRDIRGHHLYRGPPRAGFRTTAPATAPASGG